LGKIGKGVDELGSLKGQGINVRSFYLEISSEVPNPVVQVINYYEEEIGLLSCLCKHSGNRICEEQYYEERSQHIARVICKEARSGLGEEAAHSLQGFS
jgi:hypothetical protein